MRMSPRSERNFIKNAWEIIPPPMKWAFEGALAAGAVLATHGLGIENVHDLLTKDISVHFDAGIGMIDLENPSHATEALSGIISRGVADITKVPPNL